MPHNEILNVRLLSLIQELSGTSPDQGLYNHEVIIDQLKTAQQSEDGISKFVVTYSALFPTNPHIQRVMTTLSELAYKAEAKKRPLTEKELQEIALDLFQFLPIFTLPRMH